MLLPQVSFQSLPKSNERVQVEDSSHDYSIHFCQLYKYSVLPVHSQMLHRVKLLVREFCRVLMLARHFAFTINELPNTFVYTVSDERYRSSWNFKPRFRVFLIGFETSPAFRLPLLFRCSSISFLVNTGKLLRDLHHGISFAVCALGFSVLSAMFEVCPPEPHFHVFARVLVTNGGMVYPLR